MIYTLKMHRYIHLLINVFLCVTTFKNSLLWLLCWPQNGNNPSITLMWFAHSAASSLLLYMLVRLTISSYTNSCAVGKRIPYPSYTHALVLLQFASIYICGSNSCELCGGQHVSPHHQSIAILNIQVIQYRIICIKYAYMLYIL